jgi:hypothetical protein
MKMLLVADGQLAWTTPAARRWRRSPRTRGANGSIQTLAELQDKLTGQGFLLLNASLVFRKHVAPPSRCPRLAAVPADRAGRRWRASANRRRWSCGARSPSS